MTDTDVSLEIDHMTRAKNIPGKPVVFTQMQTVPLHGDNARSVLPPMLQNHERIIECLIDGAIRENSDDATHFYASSEKSIH